MTSRTLLIDAIEAPTATTMATDRIVRIEIETPISRRLPSLDVVAYRSLCLRGIHCRSVAGAPATPLPRPAFLLPPREAPTYVSVSRYVSIGCVRCRRLAQRHVAQQPAQAERAEHDGGRRQEDG